MSNFFNILFINISLTLLVGQAVAQEVNLEKKAHTIGGPTEVVSQLEEDNQETNPKFRFPVFDQGLQSLKDWKAAIYQKHGFKAGVDYTLLYQELSDTLISAEHDNAATGVARFYSQWELLNRGEKNQGSLVFKVDHRHGINGIPNDQLGGEAGYLSQTGMLFSDAGLILVDLNWQQYINDDQSVFMVGRFDPNDYHNVLGYANPWTSFSNLDSLMNMSIALPDASFGIAAGHWFENSTYIWGSVNDANGTIDTLEIFEQGFDELYKAIEFGYSPSREQRYFKNIHVMFWQMDDRTAYGEHNLSSDAAEGVVFGANYTWENELMIFGKLGFSEVDSAKVPQLYEKHMTIGLINYFGENADLFGLSLSHGLVPEKFGTPNDSQTTLESFYRVQLAKNIALTPSIQYLMNPALNTQDDIFVFGVRVRFTL